MYQYNVGNIKMDVKMYQVDVQMYQVDVKISEKSCKGVGPYYLVGCIFEVVSSDVVNTVRFGWLLAETLFFELQQGTEAV